MPEPILLSIATAVTSKVATGLYELVRTRFSEDPVAMAALEAAADSPEDSPAVAELARALEQAERQDSAFGEQLRAECAKAGAIAVTQTGTVSNHISGAVHGKVVQADTIHGSVTM